MKILRHLVQLGVSSELTSTDAKHVRFTNVTALIASVMTLAWVPVNYLLGQWLTAVLLLLTGAVLLTPLVLNVKSWYRSAVTVLVGVTCISLSCFTMIFGTESGVQLYLIMVAFGSYLLFQKKYEKSSHFFGAIAGLTLIFFTAFSEWFPPRIKLIDLELFYTINFGVAIFGLVFLAAVFRNLVTDTEDALAEEQARADRLLLNVLPASIAERLKNSPEAVIADRYTQVTVLFADIVGFTPLSARLSAAQTVDILNQIFTEFDSICEQFAVEKIRTIGDGYMAVVGAPVPCSDHAANMAYAAVAMRDYLNTNPVDELLQVRIGLNSGEAVAGIVGTTRFHFDLWGDAVNVAARMESLGEPGRVHIAKGTYDLIKNTIPCESRGVIDVKGKGEMETWYIK